MTNPNNLPPPLPFQKYSTGGVGGVKPPTDLNAATPPFRAKSMRMP